MYALAEKPALIPSEAVKKTVAALLDSARPCHEYYESGNLLFTCNLSPVNVMEYEVWKLFGSNYYKVGIISCRVGEEDVLHEKIAEYCNMDFNNFNVYTVPGLKIMPVDFWIIKKIASRFASRLKFSSAI